MWFVLPVWVAHQAADIDPALGQTCENYYRFLYDYPANTSEPVWSDEAQGLAHDDGNWYITCNDPPRLWKIPVGLDVQTADRRSPGVLVVEDLRTVPGLELYSHIGDPVCVQNPETGTWFLFVPMDRHLQDPDFDYAVAAIDVTNWWYVDYDVHRDDSGDYDANVTSAWCAVDAEGFLYFPYTFPNNGNPPYDGRHGVARYAIDWPELQPGGNLRLVRAGEFPLLGEEGQRLDETNLDWRQGGEFSPSGELLYTVWGSSKDEEETVHRDGIHVFDTRTWRRVAQSANGSGLFNYQWDPSGEAGLGEEPEGLTIWDLDDRDAPNIWGQMHVLVLDNEVTPDGIIMKHYAGVIHVNGAYVGIEHGIPPLPYTTVAQANSLAWDGACIRIKANSYPESLTLNKHMWLQAVNGTVSIGE